MRRQADPPGSRRLPRIAPAAPEQALHPRGDPRQHAADLIIGRRRQEPELERSFLALEEDAVEEQRVKMNVEIQAAAEALDDRHRARSPGADAIAARALPLSGRSFHVVQRRLRILRPKTTGQRKIAQDRQASAGMRRCYVRMRI
jgi:hypothetical protein